MHHPYRKFLFMARVFFLLTLFFACTVHAETLEILPQFEAAEKARDMSNLTFQDAKGNLRHVSDYRGKLVLLNIWATWCVPCRREMPALDNLQGTYRNTLLRILPVSIDNGQSLDKVLAFYHENRIKHLPALVDKNLVMTRELHPMGLPTSFLIDTDGRLVGEIEGFAPWDSAEAANLIEFYLQKQSGRATKN